MKSLLTVEHLATHIRKSVASIRSDATRNPKSLPPLCRLPGTKRLLWRVEDVEIWLATHVASRAEEDIPQQLMTAPQRGRPTKVQQLAKLRAQRNVGTTEPNHPGKVEQV